MRGVGLLEPACASSCCVADASTPAACCARLLCVHPCDIRLARLRRRRWGSSMHQLCVLGAPCVQTASNRMHICTHTSQYCSPPPPSPPIVSSLMPIRQPSMVQTVESGRLSTVTTHTRLRRLPRETPALKGVELLTKGCARNQTALSQQCSASVTAVGTLSCRTAASWHYRQHAQHLGFCLSGRQVTWHVYCVTSSASQGRCLVPQVMPAPVPAPSMTCADYLHQCLSWLTDGRPQR